MPDLLVLWCMLSQTVNTSQRTKLTTSAGYLAPEAGVNSHIWFVWVNSHINAVFTLQADDTYMQLKKDLEYLDLKVRFRDVQTWSADSCLLLSVLLLQVTCFPSVVSFLSLSLCFSLTTNCNTLTHVELLTQHISVLRPENVWDKKNSPFLQWSSNSWTCCRSISQQQPLCCDCSSMSLWFLTPRSEL